HQADAGLDLPWLNRPSADRWRWGRRRRHPDDLATGHNDVLRAIGRAFLDRQQPHARETGVARILARLDFAAYHCPAPGFGAQPTQWPHEIQLKWSASLRPAVREAVRRYAPSRPALPPIGRAMHPPAGPARARR